MLNYSEATAIVLGAIPNGDIRSSVEYEDSFIFQVFNPDTPSEEEMSPFYSVNRVTGEFSEYSILYGSGCVEVAHLFRVAQGGTV